MVIIGIEVYVGVICLPIDLVGKGAIRKEGNENI
jgi:hypothetical protein